MTTVTCTPTIDRHLVRTLRAHRRDWTAPDACGRIGMCRCGHWDPAGTHGTHLIEVLAAAGIAITDTRSTP